MSEAAAMLRLPVCAVESLADNGFLAPVRDGNSPVGFRLSDVKAFLARNADNGTGTGLLNRALAAGPRTDGELAPGELIEALDERAEDMANRVFTIFSTVFPEAGAWPSPKKGEFVRQAKDRFEAILAVTEHGMEADSSLFEELRAIGASASQSGTSLPQLLAILRMSRDLVVQNAVDVADSADRHGGYALSLLLTRILPAMDRLGDSLSQGYWEAQDN